MVVFSECGDCGNQSVCLHALIYFGEYSTIIVDVQLSGYLLCAVTAMSVMTNYTHFRKLLYKTTVQLVS